MFKSMFFGLFKYDFIRNGLRENKGTQHCINIHIDT